MEVGLECCHFIRARFYDPIYLTLQSRGMTNTPFHGHGKRHLLESTDSDIDDITDGICSLMTNAAIKLDMCMSQTCMRENTGEKSQNKPGRRDLKQNNYHWFEAECKKKRTEYRKAKSIHKCHANYYTKRERIRAHIKYKKFLN